MYVCVFRKSPRKYFMSSKVFSTSGPFNFFRLLCRRLNAELCSPTSAVARLGSRFSNAVCCSESLSASFGFSSVFLICSMLPRWIVFTGFVFLRVVRFGYGIFSRSARLQFVCSCSAVCFPLYMSARVTSCSILSV